MDLKQLDLTSFEKAIASLNEAVTEFKKQTSNKFIRDATSHTDNEKKAEEVYSIIPPFLIESQKLLAELHKRTAG